MTRLAASVLAASVASVLVSQGRFSYVDRANTLSAQAASGRLVKAGTGYRLTLGGSVQLESKTQGVSMRAGSITIDISPGARNAQANDLRKAVATGSVTLVKTGGGSTVTLKGSRGEYVKRATDGLATVAGPVSLVNLNSAKRQSVSATGSAGTAVLSTDRTSSKPLRSATLTGSVRVTLIQSDGTKITGTGSRLVLEPLASPARATLTGGVTIRGEGNSSLGTIQNVAKAVLTLNDAGEVVSFEVG